MSASPDNDVVASENASASLQAAGTLYTTPQSVKIAAIISWLDVRKSYITYLFTGRNAITHGTILQFFAPYRGRVAPIIAKFGTANEIGCTMRSAKFHVHRVTFRDF